MLCLLKSFLIFLLCLRFSVLCLFYNYFNCFSVSYDISAFLFFFKMFFVDLFLPLLLLLLLLSRFSRVRLCATPKTRQPTRLPHPWDSPGKNTGVGCHFRLQRVKVKTLSRVRPLATPWTVAHQAPASMGFSRQEYWSGLPLPSPLVAIGGMKLV